MSVILQKKRVVLDAKHEKEYLHKVTESEYQPTLGIAS